MDERKVVLITGCSSGFGFLCALKFARAGFLTFASVRNLESEGAVKLLEIKREESLSLEVVRIDVCDEQSVVDGVLYAHAKAGRIDILINNAGFGYLGPIEEFTIDEIRDQYETNVFGMLRLVKEVAPRMRSQRLGLIINLSSISGLVSFPLFSVYSSSKFAVETISEGLRFELAHFGIKVVLVEPGSFLTSFASNRKHPKAFGSADSPYKNLTDNFFRRYQKTHDHARVSFLSKVANPEKVAELVFKVAQEKNPRLRYLIGSDAHLYYWLRRLLPFRVWEWLLHKFYRW